MGSEYVWACALSDCSHYMPSHMTIMINGKASLCWKCGEKFTLNPANMRMIQPECDSCRGIDIEEMPLSSTLQEFINKE